MKPFKIKARCSDHALLKDGEIPIIGYWTGQYVCFHFGSEHADFFYFHNGTMISTDVTDKRPKYINDIYREGIDLAADMTLSASEFIDLVVNAYVFNEMGF